MTFFHIVMKAWLTLQLALVQDFSPQIYDIKYEGLVVKS